MTFGPLYMDAVIRPNQSLSKTGLRVVMGISIGMATIPFVMSLVIGAPFPPLFLGLDVVGLWLALTLASRAAGERSEQVQVSGEHVRVFRRKGADEKRIWSSPTAFTRVDVSGHGHETRVRLCLSGKRLTVAAAMSPDERRAFGEALRDALKRARAERYGD